MCVVVCACSWCACACVRKKERERELLCGRVNDCMSACVLCFCVRICCLTRILGII
jgi:hypothetical protein